MPQVWQRSVGLMRYASVCDGIGAAHVAWQPLGWECAWTSEIEPFPAAVVDHHWKFNNLGDMTAITEEMLKDAGNIQLLVGGTPCQSFSVAGLRGGLADPRGNLALRFVQLVGVLRPSWVVWENVPGVLSSGGGRDFGTFLGALAELGYGFAYRVLDAQWFGVAQRRRRVFVVAHARDWRRAAAVLFERESLLGNPPTRGATGQGITSSPQGITGNVSSKWAKGTGRPAGDECYNLVAFAQNQREEVRELGDCSTALNLQGTHQQTFLVTPYTKAKRAQSTTDDETWVLGEVSPTMSCFDQGDKRATTVVAFTTEQAPKFKEDCALTITMQSPSGGGQPQCVACEVADTLSVGANQTTGFVGDAVASCEVSSSLRSNPGSGWRSNGTPVEGVVISPMAVRRLTPKECERLQGFPDGYTAVTYRGKPASDGPRYRALGNSMAVPVMAWIGQRIQMVEEAADGR
jgi:DNA (cytosine-5)-methyltransferase 1